MNKTPIMSFRVPPEIRRDFINICEQQGSSASAEIRLFMEQRIASTSDDVSNWFETLNAMSRRHVDEKQAGVEKRHLLKVKQAAEAKRAESEDIMQQMEVDRRHSLERRELDAEIEAMLERQSNEKFAHKHKRALAN